ncbi:TonB-dependent copper receptor [Neptuniibacter sp. CAU 1671]|uniref:TonB-dependent copper receptor n=1 Tax=Neptuniibacter sp. CAU 1671 TaxID=3032593 RepID=UPI0023DBCDB5|nr:TonB-dependent copper receptor [Neptuniibacter sp. CAU 1671]MDF2180985.1 TonB-dependent copper receptor [Neptuniibacter sp. CAU 1671]
MKAAGAICSVWGILGHSVVMAAESPLLIEITEGVMPEVGEYSFIPESLAPSPVADGAELLLQVNGISGSRMGGRAIDPIIRGQKETQLNILLDGSYLHGACPNRMDPPTAYTAADTYDKVTVIKGNRTVVYGAGGSGGTVLFERDWPIFSARGSLAELSGGWRENNRQWDLTADLAAGSDRGYLRFITHAGEAQDYEDGHGESVAAGWQSASNTLMAGIKLGDNTRLQISHERVDEEDIDFPGAQMDSPYADAKNSRVRLEHDFHSAVLKTARFDLYRSDVVHLMENTLMSSPSTSDTTGGRLLVTADLWQTAWQFGVDLQKNERDALAYMLMSGMPAFSQWPGVVIEQQGIFLEGDRALDTQNRVQAGLRYDHVRADADKVDRSYGMGMGAATPASLYNSAYGETNTHSAEDNLGGFLTWQHRFASDYQLDTTLSRSVRTADATERYMARHTMSGDWIGNPQLEPEKHHQLELVLSRGGPNSHWQLSGWYNRVDDYILRYRSANNEYYRNIAAELYGAEAELNWVFRQGWQLDTQLAWLRGNNRDNGQALSRIAPLSWTTQLSFRQGDWRYQGEWQLVAAQKEVCLSSDPVCGGQDVRQTPGYGVVNLHAEYSLTQDSQLSLGMDNLFDKAYSLHESKDSVLESDPIQVMEPGRSLWMNFRLTF